MMLCSSIKKYNAVPREYYSKFRDESTLQKIQLVWHQKNNRSYRGFTGNNDFTNYKILYLLLKRCSSISKFLVKEHAFMWNKFMWLIFLTNFKSLNLVNIKTVRVPKALRESLHQGIKLLNWLNKINK